MKTNAKQNCKFQTWFHRTNRKAAQIFAPMNECMIKPCQTKTIDQIPRYASHAQLKKHVSLQVQAC